MPYQPTYERLLAMPEVMRLTSLGRSSIYAAMRGERALPRFPRPVRIGRRVAWRQRDVQAWIADRIAAAAAA